MRWKSTCTAAVTTLIHSSIGLIHLLAALTAMLTGAIVLFANKATRFHRRIGYVYVLAMAVVNLTAFGIHHLYGRFGPFHVAALFSGSTILGGIGPMLFRRRIKGWLHWHYFFMNWSVVGLYAAFWAETLVRLFPIGQFWPVVVAATVGTTITGSILIRKNADRFLKSEEPVMLSEA